MRDQYNRAGQSLFEDLNAWIALVEIFSAILKDPILARVYIVIDALDECIEKDRSKLLEFIMDQSAASTCAKWIISSRDWPQIERDLQGIDQDSRLSLELNTTSISESLFILSRASTPSSANTNEYLPSRICFRNFCFIRASRSASSSATNIFGILFRRLRPWLGGWAILGRKPPWKCYTWLICSRCSR